MYSTVINNKRIWEFYNSNPHINVEAINLILLDLIEKINSDMTSTITNTINSEILSSVKEIKHDVSSITNALIVKFHEINKECIESVKLIVSSASSENTDRIFSALDRNTDTFINRLNIEFPKSSHELNIQLKDKFQTLQKTIIDDIKSELSTTVNKENGLKEYISGMDSKIQQLQQPIYSFISANQEQINANLNSLRDANSVAQLTQNRVIEELSDFLNKYRTNSNYKGKSSENVLEGVLCKMFPSDEVINTSSTMKLAGDFMLKREGKLQILIENKNYDLNVQKEGVEKFLRDIRAQKCNGIFMSQHSGIQYKPNYFIEIEDGCVLIYLHNVNYSEDIIRTAVSIIDNLSARLEELGVDDEDGYVIQKSVLDRINVEFQVFVSKKETMLFNLKEFNKSFTAQIDDLNMPDLSSYLNSKYASLQNQKWVCDVCSEAFTKKASLSSHKKKHKTAKNTTPTNFEQCEIVISEIAVKKK